MVATNAEADDFNRWMVGRVGQPRVITASNTLVTHPSPLYYLDLTWLSPSLSTPSFPLGALIHDLYLDTKQ